LFLVTGVTVGVLLSVTHIHSWGLVLVEAMLAGVGSVVADRLRLRPNGPFFGILALGACASVPTSIPMLAAVLICAGSAAFSIAVGFCGWIRLRTWNPAAVRAAAPLVRQKALVHAARYVLAVGAAGACGVLSGSGHPHWAMAAAAVPLAGADLPSSVHRGIHRIVGTFLGLAIVAVVLFPGPYTPLQFFPGQEAAVLAVLVIGFQFTTELFMTRHYGLAMVSFTPVILLMTQLAFPEDPLLLVTERGVETLVGAVIGILVVVAVRARRVPAVPGPGEFRDRRDTGAAS
jgi:hypothetical protein